MLTDCVPHKGFPIPELSSRVDVVKRGAAFRPLLDSAEPCLEHAGEMPAGPHEQLIRASLCVSQLKSLLSRLKLDAELACVHLTVVSIFKLRVDAAVYAAGDNRQDASGLTVW